MKVKELKRLLSYFSDSIDVVMQDRESSKKIEIEEVAGFVDNQGTFAVRLLYMNKEPNK